MNKQYRAFTLVELLIVIAIIALLTAILLPVFARAREKTRTAMCSSNLKQLHVASALYAQDWDEVFPSMWLWNPYGMKRHSVLLSSTEWSDLQANQGCQTCPYTKNVQLYICPSVNTVRSFGYTYPPMVGSFILINNISFPVGTGLVEIKQPTTTVMMCDGGRWRGTAPMQPDNRNFSSPDELDSGFPYVYRPYTNNSSAPYAVHNNMTNFAFVDGHVKAMTPEATVSPIDMWIK